MTDAWVDPLPPDYRPPTLEELPPAVMQPMAPVQVDPLAAVTPGGYPYPLTTDNANQGANDIKALALALDRNIPTLRPADSFPVFGTMPADRSLLRTFTANVALTTDAFGIGYLASGFTQCLLYANAVPYDDSQGIRIVTFTRRVSTVDLLGFWGYLAGWGGASNQTMTITALLIGC